MKQITWHHLHFSISTAHLLMVIIDSVKKVIYIIVSENARHCISLMFATDRYKVLHVHYQYTLAQDGLVALLDFKLVICFVEGGYQHTAHFSR